MNTFYFFADFDNYTATISNKKLGSFIYKDVPIKWKNNGIIILSSNINFKFIKNIKKSNKQIVGLLKSNLQKQIRRKLASSFTTTRELLNINPFELFRRLIIISFEDVIPNIHTSLLCWLMAAMSKNLVLNDKIINFTYNYLKILLENNKYITDNLNTLVTLDTLDTHNLLTIDIIDKFNHTQKNIIKAIYFRTAYGGLKGDLIMINNVLCNYLNNNIKLEKYKKTILNNKLYIYGPLKIHICAIDHHIYPAIIDFLYSKFNKIYSKQLLETIIWECNSKKNVRKNQDIKLEHIKIFKIIKNELRLLQYKYLNNIIYCF